MSKQKVREIYEHLFDFEHSRKGADSYPIHKRLNFNGKYTDITEWISDQIDIPDDARILDAGCGTGFTLMSLCKGTKRSGWGISLSLAEVASANAAAARQGLGQQCQFKVFDFSIPFGQKFDVIIAIESIKHAPDLTVVLNNLSSHLKPNGQLIILEDLYVPNIVGNRLGKAFLNKWSVKELYTEDYYHKVLNKDGLKYVATHDFTEKVYKKHPTKTRWKIRATAMAAPFMGKKRKSLAQILHGGQIMDYFYAMGAFEYKMMVFAT